jgi:TRAP-type C4-dicarboxylate transport system substrate-binding protein
MQKAAQEAIGTQRKLAVEEEDIARRAIESAGGEVVELTPDERAVFVRAVKPLHDDARKRFGEEMFAFLRTRDVAA